MVYIRRREKIIIFVYKLFMSYFKVLVDKVLMDIFVAKVWGWECITSVGTSKSLKLSVESCPFRDLLYGINWVFLVSFGPIYMIF